MKNLAGVKNSLLLFISCVGCLVSAGGNVSVVLAASNSDSAAQVVETPMLPSYHPQGEKLAPIMGASACHGLSNLHTTRKVVALTFDDGPHKKYTEQILTILKLHNIKATFFFIGKNIKEYPDIVKAAYNDGNIIGNHTYSHHHLNRLADEVIETELTKTNDLINQLLGVYPVLFRPPYGACSIKSVRIAKNLNFKTIMWNAMVDDYHIERTTAEKIATAILGLVRPGTIIGLHDGGGNREKTVAALRIIVRELKSQGYEFLTIPELLKIQGYIPTTVTSSTVVN